MDHLKDEILIDLLLDELSESDVHAVREHLDSCDACSSRVRELMSVMACLDEFDEVEPSKSIRENVLAELGFIDRAKIKTFPSRIDIYWAAKRNRAGFSAAAAVAILIIGIYIWQIFAPHTLSELYGFDFTNAKLNVPSTVQPDSVIPVAVGIWDDTGRIDKTGRLNEVTVQLASDDTTILTRQIPFKAGEMSIEQLDLRGIEPGKYDLTASIRGSELISKPISIEKSFDIQIDMNRPIYRPGEEIRGRVQARNIGGASAADETAIFVLRCPLDSLITHQSLELNEYGVAEFRYPLADIVPIGEYLASVRVGRDEIQKIIYVDTYQKPRFRVAVESDHDFITWNQGFNGRVKSDYFFAKPVSQADITLEWHVTINGVLTRVLVSTDRTDENGIHEFNIKPSTLSSVPNPADNEIIETYLSVTVTDSSGRRENLIKYLPYSRNPVQVRLYPENGRIVPAVENRFFVLASDPNGTPVEANVVVDIDGDKFIGTTSKSGLHSFTYRPHRDRFSVVVYVTRESFDTFTTRFPMSVKDLEFPFIVKSLKAEYNYGDELEIDIIVPSPWRNRVHLNLYKGDTWIASRDVDIVNDTTRLNWRIPPVTGELTIEAHLMRKLDYLAKDKTRVAVGESKDINVAVSLDNEVYRPGSMVNADISVDRGGEPKQSSIGVKVADKSLIEAGRRAESISKIMSDTIMSGMEHRLQYEMAEYAESEKQNIIRAIMSSRLSEQEVATPLFVTDADMAASEREAKTYHLSLIGNYPFIYIRAMLTGLLYAGVLLALVTSIINIKRTRANRLIIGGLAIRDMRSFAIITAIAVVLLTMAIYTANVIVLAIGFIFTLSAIVGLIRCAQRDDIVANISTLVQILSVSLILITALLLAHQGIWNPVLRNLAGVHPFLDIAFMSVLALIGCLAILSMLFITERGGEIR